MSLPALPVNADTRSITERVNVLIRDYNRAPQRPVPTGMVLPFAGATAPDGFLLCDGSAVGRATWPDLFAAIGTTYGAGNGSTTFNLPDLRGRIAAGRDDMGGAAANRITLGVSGIAGTALGAVGGDQRMQSHAHGLQMRPDLLNAGGAAAVFMSGSLSSSTDAAGQGASQNVQPTLILNYVIAT
jgi:microcystin-dependent protein